MFGGSMANTYKIETYCKKEMKDLNKNIDKYIKKSQLIMKKSQKIFEKKEDYLTKELMKKKGKNASEFQKFILKRLKKEKSVKKIILRRFELYFRDAKKGLDKFIQLNRKLEEKLDVTNYNDFALEALKVSSKGGVGPEFLPIEAKRLFDSVKRFMHAAKKQGV